MMQSNSTRFPWYDGFWLENYYAACDWFAKHAPEKLDQFTSQIDAFRTPLDFEVLECPNFLDAETLAAANDVVQTIRNDELENGELFSFGRMIVRGHEHFTALQQSLVPKISSLVGEPVEPRYNFLSLYNNFGVCPVHMDAPTSKWTVDICLDQSYEWPIKFSKIMPWPDGSEGFGEDWQDQIVNGQNFEFNEYTLQPGNAIIFSGSSQFHYRDQINRGNKGDFCNLIFLHYIPKGTNDLGSTNKWRKIFDEPDLKIPYDRDP